MKVDLLNMASKNAAPILALGAVATIALVTLIDNGRAGDVGHPEPIRVSLSAQDDGIVTGSIAVGQTEAPAVETIHTGLAKIDAVHFPKGLVAAHATLPLGAWARLTNLSSGRSVAARITERPANDSPHIVVISGDLAKGLGLDATVDELPLMVEPLQRSPRDSRILALTQNYDPNQISTASIGDVRNRELELETIANASRFLEFGDFDLKDEAEQVLAKLETGQLTDGRFGRARIYADNDGESAIWRVSLGPVEGWTKTIEARRAAREAGLPDTTVIRR